MNENTGRRLLSQLADGRWHSGEALANQLGISRAAVWKQIRGLRQMGLEVFTLKGRGYRLAQAIEWLEPVAIKAHISPSIAKRPGAVEVLFTTTSTNQALRNADPQQDPQLCFAEYQSAGRGRRGRSWHSPLGANLYFSLGWSFAASLAQPAVLGLVAGIALAERLGELGCVGLGLKWPNDLVFDGKKLGGILVEHRGEAAGPGRAVIGVGLNLNMSEATTADHIQQPWTSLAAAWRGESMPGRNHLAGSVADSLLTALVEFERDGFKGFLGRWRALDSLMGRKVRVLDSGAGFEGQALGIAQDGGLIVRVGGAERRVHAGEVSVRPGA